MMKRFYAPLTLLLFVATALDAQTLHSAPRLVVNISIDQLRTDYLEAFSALYGNDGFKKIMNDGRVYTNVSYPFAPIDRASAIAAITTGTTPYYNSIVGERWLSRETLRPVECTDDAGVSGLNTAKGASAAQMLTSTVGDELKVASRGKAVVYSVAPFRDAAVLSAGHAADGALWIDDDNGNWASSTAYFKSLPSWAVAWNSINAPARSIDSRVWTPSSTLSGNFSYFIDGGVKKPFSHKFSGARRYRTYKTSAMVNADVTDMATHCVASTGMGLDGTTDLLNVTYYAGCFDHLPVNDCQMELQDTYVRLDHEIGRLVTALEKRMGRDGVLFVITGTGYSDEEQTDYSRYKIPSGTFYINRTANLLNIYLGGLWGQGRYVDGCFGSQIFLNRKTLEDKHISISDANDRAVEMVSMMSGVRNVYTARQLLTDQNAATRRVRNGFSIDRCGDIIIEVAPGWRLYNEDNLESQLCRASYIQFPIIIYGAGTHAERIVEPVTVERIAPTIAKAIRIRAPNACSSQPLF